MADESLPSGYIEAGRDYYSSLQKLGLEPDGLFWAWDLTINDFVLVLVTRHFDYAGPLEIYRLLTRAYNLSATPKEISPFILRVHSPDQAIIRNMVIADGHTADGRRNPNMTANGEIADLRFINHWSYKWPPTKFDAKPKKQEPVQRAKEFRRFRENVEKLAA